jgi:hypothetical protein
MMFDPMLHGELVEQRKQDMLRQARLQNLSRVALGDRDGLHLRWLALVADVLIAGGTELKRRCTRTIRRPITIEDTPMLGLYLDRL